MEKIRFEAVCDWHHEPVTTLTCISGLYKTSYAVLRFVPASLAREMAGKTFRVTIEEVKKK